MNNQQVYKLCAEIALTASSGPDAANKIISSSIAAQTRRKDTVAAMVRAVASKFKGAFHVSELKRAVLKLMPEAREGTVEVAIFHLANRDRFLERLSRQHYKVLSK